MLLVKLSRAKVEEMGIYKAGGMCQMRGIYVEKEGTELCCCKLLLGLTLLES